MKTFLIIMISTFLLRAFINAIVINTDKFPKVEAWTRAQLTVFMLGQIVMAAWALYLFSKL